MPSVNNRKQPMATHALCKTTAAVLFSALALSACNPMASWDAPLTCRGTEDSRSWVGSDPGAPIVHKSTPLVVNFQLGSDQVTVKSTTARLLPSSDGWVHFSAQAPAFWQAGQFNPASGELSLVGGRQLRVDGQVQHVTHTGRFSCAMI